MNKIEQMLQALCPNGVRYLSLGECIEIYTGIQFNKRDMSEVGTYPVLNGGINPSGFSENTMKKKILLPYLKVELLLVMLTGWTVNFGQVHIVLL